MNWIQEHKKSSWVGLVICILVVVGAGFYFFRFHYSNANAKGGNGQSNQAKTMRVRVIYPKEGGVERLVVRPGDVRSFEYADLYAKVSGYLQNQTVDIGDPIKKGELLAEVYAPELYKKVKKAGADLEEARANVQSATAKLNKSKADLSAAQSRYEQSKTDVQRSKVLANLRKKQYQRYLKLSKERAIDEELVDEKMEAQLAAESAETAAEKAEDTARSQVAAAKATVVQSEAELTHAKSFVDVEQAALDQAEVWSRYTQITSPYNGVVTRRSFHNGEFIRDAEHGGDTPLLSVARIDKMRVVIYVPDMAVPYLKKGDTVELNIDALPHRTFHGKVARLAYAEAIDTRTMRTEVDLDNHDGILKDGMYGRMTISLGREEGVRVPSVCLFGTEQSNERSLFVIRNGKAEQVKVEVGTDDGIEATIREGLSTSDQVVAEHSSGLTDGSPVEVIGIGLESIPTNQKSSGNGNSSAGNSGGTGGSGKKNSQNREADKPENAKSNFSDKRDSERTAPIIQKELKEFQKTSDKNK